MWCFYFFVGLPVTTPTAVGGGMGIKKKEKHHAEPCFRNSKFIFDVFLFALATFQSFQYLAGAEIPSGTKSIEIAKFLNEEILAKDPAATIGIVNNSPVAALFPADRKYQRTLVGNNTPVGIHPLSLPSENLPTYLFNIKKDDSYRNRLEALYEPLPEYPTIWRIITDEE